MAEHTTQPGWWFDVRRQWWEARDSRGQHRVTVTVEAARRIPRDILVSRLRRTGALEPPWQPVPDWARHG